MKFGEILDLVMTETKTSNYRLAKKLNIHPSTVANWRSGITEPKYETIIKIEDIFKIAILPSSSAQLPHDAPDDENPWGLAIMEAFEKLNPEGQQKAVERVEELTEIPKYRR